MRTRITISLLAISFSAGGAYAQDRNEVIMKKLYSKLQNTLGISSLAGTGGANLLLAAPGYVVDKTNIDYNTPDGEKLLTDIVDATPLPNWILRSSDQKLSDIYNTVLGYHETPIVLLTQDQKNQLAAARKFLYDDSKLIVKSTIYKNYDKTQNDFYTAATALQTWQAANPHKTAPAPLTLAYTKALGNWNGTGHRAEVQAALSVMETLDNHDPATFWGRLSLQYSNYQKPLGAGTYPQYDYYPAYQSWIDNSQNWTAITLNDSEFDKIATSSHTDWGGGFSAGWGLWSVGGGYGESTTRTSLNIDSQAFNLGFEILRVKVTRPWMDKSIFGARTWRWTPASIYDRRLLSDGQNDGHTTPTGIAPFLIDELILARKVSLSGKWNTSLATTYHNEKHGGGHFGWGPFSFGGMACCRLRGQAVKLIPPSFRTQPG